LPVSPVYRSILGANSQWKKEQAPRSPLQCFENIRYEEHIPQPFKPLLSHQTFPHLVAEQHGHGALPHHLRLRKLGPLLGVGRHGVAVHVAFESKSLKPVSHLKGSRVETGRFQAVGQLNSTRTQPHHGGAALDVEDVKHRAVERHSTLTAYERANFETRISHFRFKGWVTKPGGAVKRYGSTAFNTAGFRF
jgi:hypothetical protein